MNSFKKIIKNRLISTSIILSVIILAFIIRLGYLQIVKGDRLRIEAVEQWTRDLKLEPKRGVIYDRNGKKLATNLSLFTVSAMPHKIKEENYDKYTKKISEILEVDEEKVYSAITADSTWMEIKRYVDRDKALNLKEESLRGISIDEEVKRYYPFEDFLSQVLGNTNRDSVGQYGVEKSFDKYLMGTPGRWIKTVDGNRMELPYNYQKKYEPKDGANIVLSIDETIQHYAEKAAYQAVKENTAKRASVLIMDPKTGEMLAMATSPDYNPNNRMELLYNPEKPWQKLNNKQKEEFEKTPWSNKKERIYDIWKNPLVSNIYEPGSTFKVLVGAASLEENVVSENDKFYCDGYVTQVPGDIKCWSYRDPHGEQTFKEGIQNSCNEVMVALGLRLGKEKLYEYAKAFGFGEVTGIDLPSEVSGLVRKPENMRDVNLATISFGQGISVTPIQLITAVSSLGNDGNLMQPRIVKRIVDGNGKTIKEFEPVIKKKVISHKTSKTMLDIMESVVSEGSGKKAYIPGYRVGGKTGTAEKVINGKYANGKYISSFIGIAPVDDPRISVLVIIDEPDENNYYGGQIAAPIAKQVIEDTLTHLNVERRQENNTSKTN